MKLTLFTLLLLIALNPSFSQEKIEWSKGIEIDSSCFKASIPNLAEDNLQEYSFACSYNFNFQMIGLQFAFTKNFNSYVSAYYNPHLSWMEEGELTWQLLLMANLDFDLVELYARKFRKKMFEAKNVGSNVNFFNKLHEEVNREYLDRQSVIQSNLRTNENIEDYLKLEIEKVNEEIEMLNEFCKTCKPKKRKKKRK